MYLRGQAVTMPLGAQNSLNLVVYWDGHAHPITTLPNTAMPNRVNEAILRWQDIAKLAGGRFTLDNLVTRLLADETLGAIKVVASDSTNGHLVEGYHPTKWPQLIGAKPEPWTPLEQPMS